jgi:hypothetical protein
MIKNLTWKKAFPIFLLASWATGVLLGLPISPEEALEVHLAESLKSSSNLFSIHWDGIPMTSRSPAYTWLLALIFKLFSPTSYEAEIIGARLTSFVFGCLTFCIVIQNTRLGSPGCLSIHKKVTPLHWTFKALCMCTLVSAFAFTHITSSSVLLFLHTGFVISLARHLNDNMGNTQKNAPGKCWIAACCFLFFCVAFKGLISFIACLFAALATVAACAPYEAGLKLTKLHFKTGLAAVGKVFVPSFLLIALFHIFLLNKQGNTALLDWVINHQINSETYAWNAANSDPFLLFGVFFLIAFMPLSIFFLKIIVTSPVLLLRELRKGGSLTTMAALFSMTMVAIELFPKEKSWGVFHEIWGAIAILAFKESYTLKSLTNKGCAHPIQKILLRAFSFLIMALGLVAALLALKLREVVDLFVSGFLSPYVLSFVTTNTIELSLSFGCLGICLIFLGFFLHKATLNYEIKWNGILTVILICFVVQSLFLNLLLRPALARWESESLIKLARIANSANEPHVLVTGGLFSPIVSSLYKKGKLFQYSRGDERVFSFEFRKFILVPAWDREECQAKGFSIIEDAGRYILCKSQEQNLTPE